ncbi:MAG: hypothetical protein JNM19_11135 [Chitinophagaceae bacterium]|nr:hypothetical protein [Chitinophagaceae bacterium]
MRSLLFFLLVFAGGASFVSGLMMISSPDGSNLNLPLSLLEGTPFDNYLVPGIILAFIVGGINMAAVALNLQRHKARYNWAQAGGVVLGGWIIVQMILIHTVHWLHFIFLGLGVLIILVAYQLKGKWAV